MGLKSIIKNASYKSTMLNYLYILLKKTQLKLKHIFVSDKKQLEKRYKSIFNKELDLNNPITLNEKIIWLKLYDHRELNTIIADKYRVRDFYKEKFGDDYLIPLYFNTKRVKDINPKNINKFPCIVKYNGGSGTWQIIKNKDDVNWKVLRNKCRRWKAFNHYYSTQEWQYKNIKPMFIVEELLQDEHGKIPNDYKFNYINGKLEFIYCSVDREAGNYRVCYNSEWEKLPFTWVEPHKHRKDLNDTNVKKPINFEKMCEIGNELAKNWPYVRIDFYECNGKLYYGEITLHHGSGNDTFEPIEYDLMYGQKVDLNFSSGY